MGNFSSKCPKVQKRRLSKGLASERTSFENKFTRVIHFNFVELCTFIDILSKSIMINRTVAKNILCELDLYSMRIKIFFGCQYWLNNLISTQVELDNIKVKSTFYVADAHLLDKNIFIGRNIFIFLLEEGRIKLEKYVEIEFIWKLMYNVQLPLMISD